MDTLSPKERSERMARVRGHNTGPERTVRSLLHSLGYRFRLHARDIPGSPDIVFRSRRAVIFVHGCFWHRHGCFNGRRMPKSRLSFWSPKLEGNKRRDQRTRRRLRQEGWRVLVIWECQIANSDRLTKTLRRFLDIDCVS